MARHQIPFFATVDEIIALSVRITSIKAYDFYEAGLFDTRVNPKLAELTEMKGFKSYLLVEAGCNITPREVSQRSGGVKYAFDQLLNPASAVIAIGGLYDENHLIASQIGSATEAPEGIALIKLFRKMLEGSTERIKSYYVSQQAAKMLDAGARLSAAPKGMLEYDLKRG